MMTAHKIHFRILVALSFLIFESCTSFDVGSPHGDATGPTGHYIVVLHEGAPSSTASDIIDSLVLTRENNAVNHRYSVLPAFAARLDAATLEKLHNNPHVSYIQEDQYVSTEATTVALADGIDRSDQRVGHDGMYDDHGRDGTGTHIYVLDTGLNTQHDEFLGRIGNGFTSIVDGRGIEDCNGHGTHVASTAAGTQYGMAKQAMVHPVRVLGCDNRGTASGVIAGIDFVYKDCPLQAAPCVANMSLGGGVYAPLNQAVANAVKEGIVFVVAAGNSSADACNYSPASEPSAITVAAIDDRDQRAWFSNHGSCVDIFAPGVTILGASIGSITATALLNGTSMASPHVAGAAAQYLSSNPTATPTQVANALQGTASIDCVTDPSGSPNALLFNDFLQGNYYCSIVEPSCEGLCGGPADGCFCEASCVEFNDCCPDYEELCT